MSQTSPGTLPAGSMGLTVELEKRPGSLRSVGAISDSLSASCKFYETMQSQLESLMLTIEQLRADILQEPAGLTPTGEPESTSQVTQVSQGIQVPKAVDVDSQFEELLNKFHHHMHWEKALQAKCRSLIDSISLSLSEPHVHAL